MYFAYIRIDGTWTPMEWSRWNSPRATDRKSSSSLGHEVMSLGISVCLKKTPPPRRWNLSIFWYIQNNLVLFWLILHFLGDFKRLCYQLPLKSGNTKYFLFEDIDSVDRIAKVERGKYASYIRLMYLCLWIVTLRHYNFVDFPLEIF